MSHGSEQAVPVVPRSWSPSKSAQTTGASPCQDVKLNEGWPPLLNTLAVKDSPISHPVGHAASKEQIKGTAELTTMSSNIPLQATTLAPQAQPAPGTRV